MKRISEERFWCIEDNVLIVGTAQGGYVYFEASEVNAFHKESLYFNVSINSNQDEGACVSFAYHMFGEDTGSLSIKIDGNSFWKKFGDQGNIWHRTNVTLRLPDRSHFTVSHHNFNLYLYLYNLESCKTQKHLANHDCF